MTYRQLSFHARLAVWGAALSCVWFTPAAAQTQQDCADSERLVALTLHGFPGMEGQKRLRGKVGSLHEMAKPAPGFKSCELNVAESLSDGDPMLVCDVLKSVDAEPAEGTQTVEMMKFWQETIGTFAADMGKCLGVKPIGPRSQKTTEGREALRWFLAIERPTLSASAYAGFAVTLDQPKPGERLDRTHRVEVKLHAVRNVKKEVEASFSKQPPVRVSVADFESFAGLRRGARSGDVLRLYGEPINIRANKSRSTLYYEYARSGLGFSVGIDAASERVEWIRLDGTDIPDWLRRRGVNDRKINLLGMYRDDVIALLGKPQNVISSAHEWEIKMASGSLLLTLRCYDHRQGQCVDMTVGWLGN